MWGSEKLKEILAFVRVWWSFRPLFNIFINWRNWTCHCAKIWRLCLLELISNLSIYRLNLYGCSRLISFPDISANILELDLDGTAIKDFPSNLRLEKLVHLSMCRMKSEQLWKRVRVCTWPNIFYSFYFLTSKKLIVTRMNFLNVVKQNFREKLYYLK